MNSTKRCKYCGEEIHKSAKTCPKCYQKQSKFPVWAKVLLGIFIVFIGIVAIVDDSDLSSDKKSKNNTGTTTTIKVEDLELEDGHKGYPDEIGFAYYIEGYIKNNKDRDYSYVQISFNAYDADGNTVGSCLANNSGLEANGRWKFKAICSGDANSIASYKLDKITKW